MGVNEKNQFCVEALLRSEDWECVKKNLKNFKKCGPIIQFYPVEPCTKRHALSYATLKLEKKIVVSHEN